MKKTTGFRALSGGLALALAIVAFPRHAYPQDDAFQAELLGIQHAWEKANYEAGDDDAKERMLESLAARSDAFARKNPGRAEPLVWEGIVLSSYAGAKGGLGALSLAKESRDRLLEAVKVDPDALDGSAFTSLGALYYKVPGWPVGFGDRDKAAQYLHKALAMNPDGIDPNFFLGELMYEKGDYAQSLKFLEKALAAPARPDRPLADSGRRGEIQALMAKVRSKQG
jgi:tetratricopeptide (TPR) repeat protein